MQFEKSRPEIFNGLASNLQSAQETLPAIEVKNHVEWINENFDLPFFEVGKSTDMGVFLTSKPDDGDKSINLEVKSRHGRSALLGRKIFTEKPGDKELFRDIDIKGLGYVVSQNTSSEEKTSYLVANIEIDRRNAEKSMGLLNLKDARKDADFSEIFHKYGIRTHRVVTIIALEEIIYQGKRISLAEARAKKIISEDAQPVLEIRAFGTHARLTDILIDYSNSDTQHADRKKADLLIEDARLFVAKEIGKDPLNFDRTEYFKWLARTTGRNLGLMHKHGYIQKYMREGHNITLDGRIVDFESSEYVGSESNLKFEEEDYSTFTAFRRMLDMSEYKFISEKQNFDDILKEYENTYKQYKES